MGLHRLTYRKSGLRTRTPVVLMSCKHHSDLVKRALYMLSRGIRPALIDARSPAASWSSPLTLAFGFDCRVAEEQFVEKTRPWDESGVNRFKS
jgi:hypothetical protein